MALIRYFFLFVSINSHTSSSKLADITLKQLLYKDCELDDDDDDDFFENNFSNSFMSSFKLFNADVADIVVSSRSNIDQWD